MRRCYGGAVRVHARVRQGDGPSSNVGRGRSLVQRQARVSSPDDPRERAADALADRVLRMDEPPARGRPRPLPASSVGPLPPEVDRTVRQPGEPLDAATRSFMEPRFGFDFSHVRIHTDAAAARSAAAVDARAYAVGSHVVFAASEYTPGSRATRALLAHELAHVAQESPASSDATAILRREQQGGGGGGGPGAAVQQYIELACQAIADIRQAVEQGRTWSWEDSVLLEGEEGIQLDDELLTARLHVLRMVVVDLDTIIQELESGALVPTEAPSRDALRRLWFARAPEKMRRANRAWAVTERITRDPRGGLQATFRSPSWYITEPAGSPAGVLRPADFPTWWVLGCHGRGPAPEPPRPQPRAHPTGPDPELGPDTVIYLNRTGGRVTGWQWEPRNARMEPTGAHRQTLQGRAYEWAYDRDAGRPYVVLDGRRVYLLPDGTVQFAR